MTDNVSTMPFVWVYDDDVTIKGKKLRITYIADTSTPGELTEIIGFLIETGLSKAEKMREILQIMERILKDDGRFTDIAAEMKSYRETVFSRSIPFTMIEARAILSKLRKWQNTIQRRSSAQNSSEF
uniref:Uncharacterized protein n=1 Tax=Candidatus Methanophagaceae archaeon ANME-1 ERB6 TaxID=2759912 RepID=A0A7G9YSG1_9EURY|nr:hypothetical protein BBGANOMO_00019 [Methanosarcinales archaeon ANME-1 ERB6]